MNHSVRLGIFSTFTVATHEVLWERFQAFHWLSLLNKTVERYVCGKGLEINTPQAPAHLITVISVDLKKPTMLAATMNQSSVAK